MWKRLCFLYRQDWKQDEKIGVQSNGMELYRGADGHYFLDPIFRDKVIISEVSATLAMCNTATFTACTVAAPTQLTPYGIIADGIGLLEGGR
jgi:hypothetical protein